MGAIRFPVLAILLFAACSFAAAAACPPTGAWSISGALACTLNNMAVVVGLGTVIGIAIGVLSYYASAIMNDERNKAGAISEIKSTIINVIIFAFVVGAILSIDKFFEVLALDPSSGNIATAITNMYRGNIDYLMSKAGQMVGIYSDAAQLSGSSSSMSLYLDLPWGLSTGLSGGVVNTIPVLERLADALSQATMTIVSICSQQAMMANLMKYFVTISCGLLLPFGFFLRAIPYVRRAGSTLVAIGIALALIYPVALFFLGSVLLGIQTASIHTISWQTNSGNDFNPAQSTFAEVLDNRAMLLRIIADSYTVVGNILVFANTIVKSAGAWAAFLQLFIPLIGLVTANATALFLKSLFFITNVVGSAIATGVIFGAHQILMATLYNFFYNNGGIATAISLEYDIAVFGTIINMTHILLLASVVLTVVGSIRALAILLGGEFFLYGLTEYM